MTPTRILAVSPGDRTTGIATCDVDGNGIALRAFAVVGHRGSRSPDRRRALAGRIARTIAAERPRLAVVEDLARKRRWPGALASLAVVGELLAATDLPVRALALGTAAGVVCGAARRARLGRARDAVAWMFPRLRCRLPHGRRAEPQGYWAPAWRAAVLGVAVALDEAAADGDQ